MMERTGCDGVMIGRGALSAPWIFRDAWALQTTGIVPRQPERPEILAIMRRYFDLMREYRGDHYAMFQIRRRVSWFVKRFRGPCKAFREEVRVATDAAAVYAAMEGYERAEFAAVAGDRGEAETGDLVGAAAG